MEITGHWQDIFLDIKQINLNITRKISNEANTATILILGVKEMCIHVIPHNVDIMHNVDLSMEMVPVPVTLDSLAIPTKAVALNVSSVLNAPKSKFV